ncbi:hypothetical protein OOT46_29635 [Aquabacterium sp. A7-Y]|uniref:hypothetical protein n=1 Tax=Aquabacterium sp. A7-Y TaxID=1349605 RepID=UPI00223E710B|nr:hypothetical protein [Aquabacterium sp. A7-Y]MCW7541964.1 hypothetical protein [Aquabacterium sp. A7-Y]
MTAATALRDTDLVDFATELGSSRKTSVIVEARRPAVTAGRSRARKTVTEPRELLPAPRKGRSPSEGGADVSGAGAAMRELEAALQRLGLAASARRNDLNGSFVVEVTPRQLRELASTPSVQAIRSNRRHRRSVA